MLYLKCDKLNRIGCDYTARGRTAWEVKRGMFDHSAKEHGHILIESTSEDRQRMMDRMDKLIIKKTKKKRR